MKSHSYSLRITSALIFHLFTCIAFAEGDANTQPSTPPATYPLVPCGRLSVNYPGNSNNPKFRWGVNHPSIVTDFVTITSPGTIVTRRVLNCKVRVIGSNVLTKGPKNSLIFRHTNAAISINGGDYTSMWWERGDLANPSEIVFDEVLPAYRTLKFGGQHSGLPSAGNTLGPWFDSDSPTQNIRALVNGDTPPSTMPAYGTDSLHAYLRPYLDPNGKVAIGPMEVLIIMELTHTDEADPRYDMQDQALLVTFLPPVASN
jgi:hypothetical protein